MTEKHVVLTGANSELGAAALCHYSSRCHVDSRDPESGKYRCNASTLHSHGQPPWQFRGLDLSLLSDVNELSDRLLAESPRLIY